MRVSPNSPLRLNASTLNCFDRVSRQANRLAELVDNLLDYKQAHPENEAWKISLRDNDIGIAPAFHKEIFTLPSA